MARHRNTGDGDEYDAAEAADVYDYLSDAIADWDSSQGRGGDFLNPRLTVTAQVEWAGTIDRNAHGGVRTVRLEGLTARQMRALRDSVEKIQTSGQSYTQTGWHAQLNRLSGTERGRAAMERAGINVTRRTYLGWLSETQTPNKANRAKLTEAFSYAQTNVREKAAGPAARELTNQLREVYGVNVRFRDIKDMKFH